MSQCDISFHLPCYSKVFFDSARSHHVRTTLLKHGRAPTHQCFGEPHSNFRARQWPFRNASLKTRGAPEKIRMMLRRLNNVKAKLMMSKWLAWDASSFLISPSPGIQQGRGVICPLMPFPLKWSEKILLKGTYQLVKQGFMYVGSREYLC